MSLHRRQTIFSATVFYIEFVSLIFKFPVFFKILKFPVFSLPQITFHHFPCFPCGVEWIVWIQTVSFRKFLWEPATINTLGANFQAFSYTCRHVLQKLKQEGFGKRIKTFRNSYIGENTRPEYMPWLPTMTISVSNTQQGWPHTYA